MSVYLKDDATGEQVQALEALIDQSGLSDKRQYLSKADALARFREDFPDQAGATERLERNPLPASIEMRLGPAICGGQTPPLGWRTLPRRLTFRP